MNLSALVLQQLTNELAPQITRRLIREAFMTRAHVLYLNLGDIGHLCCSAHPNRSYIHLSEPTDPPQENQPTWLTHHLTKSGIVSISHVPNERIIHVSLTRNDRLGKTFQYTLICELIGRHANIILTDANTQKILGATRHTRSKDGVGRDILPGRTYQPPPAQYGKPFTELSASLLDQSIAKNPTSDTQALQQAIAGLDHITAAELCHRFPLNLPPTTNENANIIPKIKDFLASPPLISGAVAIANDKNHLHLSPLQITHTTPKHTFATLNEGIAYLLTQEQVNSTLKRQITNLEKDLKGKIANNTRKLERMEEDLKDAGRADEYERLGQLLMVNLQQITPGLTSLTLSDIQDGQNREIVVTLNPNRTPIDNANEYIKRSKKARKGAPILQKRIAETQAQNTQIHQYLDKLQTITHEADLLACKKELEDAKLIKAPKPKQQQKTNKKKMPGEIHPRRYRTRDGWLVLVGRNNQENDKLTKSAARDDTFFHVHGCPGSHVILKQDGRPEKAPRSTIKEAASLAAYWSKARNAKSAPVSYTEARYVNKPRGAPAGLVTIKNEKSIMVEPREITKEDDA